MKRVLVPALLLVGSFAAFGVMERLASRHGSVGFPSSVVPGESNPPSCSTPLEDSSRSTEAPLTIQAAPRPHPVRHALHASAMGWSPDGWEAETFRAWFGRRDVAEPAWIDPSPALAGDSDD